MLQAVLFFGVETWVLLSAMSQNLEGLHLVFLRKIMGQKGKCQMYRTWQSKAASKVLKDAGTKSLRAYIYKRQANQYLIY